MRPHFNLVKDKGFPILLLIGLIGMTSALGYWFRNMGFPETNIVIVYILSVLLTARLTQGYLYGILASIIATFAFNYFFTAPYYTLSVDDASYIITFIIMTITAIVTSALTSRVKESAREAERRERETRALYSLTKYLSEATDLHEIASVATRVISEAMGCRVACLCMDEKGMPERTFIQQASKEKQILRNVQDPKRVKQYMEALNEDYYEGLEFCDWPIRGSEGLLGLMRLPKECARNISESQDHLFCAMLESTALAMDRFRQTTQRMKSNEAMVQERYRGNLLRAISHDLRTPLSGIMGTSEMLMDMIGSEDPKYNLAHGIYQDAQWLRALVENILNLTRLQEGRLMVNKQVEVVEEIIGSAVNHMSRRHPEYNITVDMPEALLLILMDAKLIEQVLINLLDNATKHSKPENEIKVKVTEEKEHNQVRFSVIDNGEGIASADLPRIFQMFYTSDSRRVDVKHGIGLGLTICESIVKAHGGIIEASNRKDVNGAIFSFTLPSKEERNE